MKPGPISTNETIAGDGPTRHWSSQLFRQLTDPTAGADALERYQMRLLAGLLLPLLVLSLAAVVALTGLEVAGADMEAESILIAAAAFGLFGLAYVLGRKGRYLQAAWLTVAAGWAGTVIRLFENPTVLITNGLPLAYLIIPILLGGLLLPLRHLLGLIVATLATSAVILMLVPTQTPLALLETVIFMLGISVLVAVGATIRHRDLEHIQRTSKSLAASAARFHAAFDQASVGMGLLDMQGRWLQVNPALCELTGYSDAEMLGSNFRAVTHPDDLQTDLDLSRQLVAGEIETFQIENRCLRKDGQVTWVLLNSSLLRDEQGRPHQFISHVQDIGARKEAEKALEQSNASLTQWLSELEQRTREIVLINEMGEMLQSCSSTSEAYRVIAFHCRQIFPGQMGAVCSQSASGRTIETVATWGPAEDVDVGTRVFEPGNCWALRRGRAYVSGGEAEALRCAHLPQSPQLAHLCLPLNAQGELLGLMHLQQSTLGPFDEARQRLAQTVADNIALTLGNLKLRETLHSQSIRDPLTALFNRRYLEETLERELRRATRAQRNLGLIMLDIDHFKKFNDAHGHAAGDSVLRDLGGLLAKHTRGGDVACRYGGEEFVLMLPEADEAAVRSRAIQMNTSVRQLAVHYGGQLLGAVTISLGIAMFPEHGSSAEDLLLAADAALYRAKHAGRDQVMVAA